jgi:hypothetical protein
MENLILCRSDMGDGAWSLHAPGTTETEIADGAGLLLSGEAEWVGDDLTGDWDRPNAADYAEASRPCPADKTVRTTAPGVRKSKSLYQWKFIIGGWLTVQMSQEQANAWNAGELGDWATLRATTCNGETGTLGELIAAGVVTNDDLEGERANRG